uniref:Uncharacterized protein n=1 Tax=Coptotermes formosanus TaxID=36987 RepID=R4V466_COPFO|nr:hypothetical protein [Coptotermes formosanus]
MNSTKVGCLPGNANNTLTPLAVMDGRAGALYDKNYFMVCFPWMGEQPRPVFVMRNLYLENDKNIVGSILHGCLLLAAMMTFHGKVIPNTHPPILLTGIHESAYLPHPLDREVSLWVADLMPDADDYTLYRNFPSRYQTIIDFKEILDNAGYHKGYLHENIANKKEH